MKTFALFTLFTSLYFVAYTQDFAIINNKDGFVNVRKEGNVHSPVVGKIYDNSIFGYNVDDNDKTEWTKILQQNETNPNYIEGYISRSRVFPLSKFKSIKKIIVYKDSCIAYNDSIFITIKSSSFNSRKHQLGYSKSIPSEQIQSGLMTIDGRPFLGTDETLPKKTISSIKVIKNGTAILIPKNFYDDLYEPLLKSLKVFMGANNTIYIEMNNSDGAGAYAVIWIIKNNQYLGRYIDNSNA